LGIWPNPHESLILIEIINIIIINININIFNKKISVTKIKDQEGNNI